jgi:hypothetical protein
VSFDNISPPLPRDIAIVLVVAFVLLIVLGFLRRSPFLFIAAGVLLGLVGLTSGGEWYFVGLAMAIGTVFVRSEIPRIHRVVAVAVPAIALYALWAVPLVAGYRRLGGFVNTTATPAVILSPAAILLSWGFVSPLAVYAAVRWVRPHIREPATQSLIVLVTVAAIFLVGSSVIPRVLGSGFETIGASSRYWPVLYLGLSILAGVAGAELLGTLDRRRILLGSILAVVVAASVATPLWQSVQLVRRWTWPEMLGAAILDRPNVVTEAAAMGRARCVTASPRYIQMAIFSLAGYRQVAYHGDKGHVGNYSRIRWRNIYDHIPSDAQRLADDEILMTGRSTTKRWQDLVRKYHVNMVVVRVRDFDAPVFRQLFPDQVSRLRAAGLPYGLLHVGACPAS